MPSRIRFGATTIVFLTVTSALAANSSREFSSWNNRPHEPFTKGAETFEIVKKTLLKSYVDKGLTEDDLYRAAVQGMLTNIESEAAAWNKLLSPTEFAELKSDIDGKIVGVGVEISFNQTTGYADVIGVIPGTPSEKAGIIRGDQILKIDGQGFRGKQMRDVVYAIRGKAGTDIKLTLLHDDQVVIKTLKRSAIVWDTINTKIIDSDTALLAIQYFTGTTPGLLKDALDGLKTKNIKRLIIDLRENEGGVLERMLESTSLFVQKNKLIVTTVKRDGKKEEILSSSDPILPGIAMVVLINGATKSGAEIMAAALKSNGAITVGMKTFGKLNAQKIEELPNKFAFKYTTAMFTAPNELAKTGQGLVPDIQVNVSEDVDMQKLRSQPDMTQLLKDDVQLQAALNVLRSKS